MNEVTNRDVTLITQQIMQAAADADAGRTSYLRTLISTAQTELGKKGQETAVQMVALKSVHERFYELVLGAVEPFVPKGTKNRAVELHRRANFTRTALSAVRRYVRAGNDLAGINSAKATKGTLAVKPTTPRPQSARRLKARAEVQSKALITTLIGLADTDKQAAVDEMQLVLGQLTDQLVRMGVASTKDAAQASMEHRPLKVGKVLFMPTQTQVLRQQARPS